MNWYIKVMKDFMKFDGRSRRKEYWMFVLFNIPVGFVIGLVVGLFQLSEIIILIYQLIIFVPSIAVGIRRVHDSNHKGWWILFPFYNLYLLVKPGDAGPNRFGPDPKESI